MECLLFVGCWGKKPGRVLPGAAPLLVGKQAVERSPKLEGLPPAGCSFVCRAPSGCLQAAGPPHLPSPFAV